VPYPRKRLFIEPVSFCNLMCKFCSYPKNLHPRTVMEEEMFRYGIDQASAMGYEEIALTPINGDVFMDKNFISRLAYFEKSSIKSHLFYTNFIAVDEQSIASVLGMKKLRYLEISVYGHDLESFRNITGRGETQYRRLIDNLAILERRFAEKQDQLQIVINLRIYRSFSFDAHPGNELLDTIVRLREAGVTVGVGSQVDNWGGDVTEDDIADIQMDMTDGKHLYRKGPCSLPFDSVQVTATGNVNACACRDPRGTLTLGEIGEMPLAQILSPRNPKWTKIVEDHENGQFSDICGACGFYQSIYDERRAKGPDGAEMISKEEYISRM